MLKDLIDKHTEVLPVSDRINVVDMLNNESGQQELVTLFNDMGVVCKELEKFEQANEQLKNESGIVLYLVSQGYEDITTESAGEVAKEIWEKIKKVISYLIDQFMIYFNKAKLLFMNLINNHEGKIKALLAILERTKKNAPNKDLMDSESFGKRIPSFENFHDIGIYFDYFKLIKESSHSVYSLDSKTNSIIEKVLNRVLKVEPEKKPRAFLGFEGNNMLNLMIKDFKYSIDSVSLSTTYDPSNKITMKPDNIKNILESLLTLLKDIKFSVNQISTKIIKYKNPEMEEEGIFSKDNIEHNVSVIIRASKMFVENNNKIIKDLIFIMTQHIKCYDNNGKTVNSLISPDDKYDSYKDIIKEAIHNKDWKTLEDFQDSPGLKKFPDILKMIEEALKNKPQ